MGLTVHGDIASIHEEIDNLKQQLKEMTMILTEEVDRLAEVVFEGDILLEEDTDWDIIRKKRNFLLRSTDWTLIPGATVDQSAWATYRQILRDLPQTYEKTGLKSFAWPKKPSLDGPNQGKKKSQLQ